MANLFVSVLLTFEDIGITIPFSLINFICPKLRCRKKIPSLKSTKIINHSAFNFRSLVINIIFINSKGCEFMQVSLSCFVFGIRYASFFKSRLFPIFFTFVFSVKYYQCWIFLEIFGEILFKKNLIVYFYPSFQLDFVFVKRGRKIDINKREAYI